MVRIIEADGKKEYLFIKGLEERSRETNEQVTAQVREIIENVRLHGDGAVLEYTQKFDKKQTSLKPIERQELEKIADKCEPKLRKALENAALNIAAFHSRQMENQRGFVTRENGVILGQRVRGLHRVGIYVPGGTAAYPSTVLMNAIPAHVAGVKEIIMVTPPAGDGEFNAAVMTAAHIAGVSRVYLCGGAQAVAALAFGTESIPKVDKIVGPGNIYVATAKKLLFGTVDIDMIAGPSEILILADDTANPTYIAADMMSQAEHDPLASSTLVTTSRAVAEQTVLEIERQIQKLSRREIIARSLKDYGSIIVCTDIDKAVELANLLAPEHLEVLCENPMDYLSLLDNAGSVFLGEYSPEPLGDYYAGPNHVLPTGGTARFFSPLSVASFLKKSSFISYTRDALKSAREDILAIADSEGLDAHANSIKVRFS
ncbi:MAG TPA: histidinol dehydrogenase [Candidatus Avimonas sp.]|nr:histidinol dehydrogenase [Clostridiales bacterium]HOB35980.1 histidinol dehydrogenase [Candidatus Avimonas sp.]HQA15669.1 histidinol dehydrogenase [Candidatus Avimonas sp.]HQD37416.1 histidinol dehydrogenase [Candidatus Avimonas sp.]